jgi:dimeric dUTPase (all-alpha-NTP-PPase superfamily)
VLNIAKLFMLQSELDAHVEDKHPRKVGESRHDKKVLAALVELGELANETYCFKFWSYKSSSTKEVILEEYVDGIHFLLSLGQENGIEKIEIKPIKKTTFTEQFIGLYNVFSLLYVYFTPKAYSEAWSAYIGLGEMLGFIWEEIETAYIEKNTVNHTRQESNY